MLLPVLERLVKQRLLYLVEQLRHDGRQVLKLYDGLLAVVAADQYALAVLDVARADLQAKREALHLVLGELPARAVLREVDLNADTGLLERLVQLICLVHDARLVCRDRDDNELEGRNLGRQHQALVVAVGHDDSADKTGRYTPGGLVHVLQRIVLIGILHIECTGKAIAEVVRGARLQRLAVVHHSLDRIGILGAGEALLLGLLALEHRDRQVFFTELGVDVQHAHGLLARLLLGGVHGVTLLPPELARAQERAGGLFPADDRAPLVIQLGQVAPRADDLSVVLTEQRLRGRAHAQALLQLLRAAVGDPGDFGGEAFDVILFALQQGLRDKERHRHILVAGLLEHAVQCLLDILPQRLGVRPHDDAALDRRVVNHLRLFDDISIPLGEIHIHGCDLRHQLFLVCHFFCSPFLSVYRPAHLQMRDFTS